MKYHHLLEKQVEILSAQHRYDPSIQQFLQLIDQSYKNLESEQKHAEHAFQACEKEYQDILHNLQLQNNIFSQSVQQLKAAILKHEPQAAAIIEREDNVLINIISYLEKQIQKTKETEAELIRAKEQAEDGARAKSDFLSVMSHEIRTPLNAIIGIAHLLLQEQLLPNQLENLKALNISAENLLRLINDILDFAKIEEGKIVLAEKNINLQELAMNIKTAHQIRAAERGNTINMVIDNALPPYVLGDEVRLGQILHNLVSNAVKFTRNGVITLQITLQQMQHDEATILFSVTDTGVGIDKEKQTLIFDRFTQANVDIAREFGGSGLGLAIVKRLAALHNSDIHLNSEVGRGSTFFFTINFKAGKPEAQARQAISGKSDLSGIKVLLVEDVEFNIMVAKKMITNWNGAVDIAENGAIAVNKLRQASYDIVLMDLQMPVMDGYNATQHIRNFNEAVPIIALTASASADILQRTREFGMTDYLAKPFKPGELYEMISKYSRQQLTS
ncbi:ATP-binding protein [Longitalea luteola]|uniref:ATP-binding protein n=1 Tax=Longitalea luteola TaxID=2812563 RepID=UPI001A95FAB8|nr:ATP-binding protein [Longitalea luteola]